MDHWCQEIRISAWADLGHLRRHLPGGWLFRGQRDATWSLSPTIERAVADWQMKVVSDVWEAERRILEKLMSLAPNYDVRLPSTARAVEWLALLQHHGGATRLLDVTSSMFVAAFFALEQPSQASAIWCVRPWALLDGAFAVCNNVAALREDETGPSPHQQRVAFAKGLVDRSFATAQEPLVVVPVDLAFRTTRMEAQQSSFLVTTALLTRFEDALGATVLARRRQESTRQPIDYTRARAGWNALWPRIESADVLKIVIDPRCRATALDDLESMNITAATLFPGFDGFARSLQQLLREFILSPEQTQEFIERHSATRTDRAEEA